MTTFTPGDHVTIGNSGRYGVHWVVDTVDTAHGDCTLISGLTGRRMFHVPMDHLTLHTSAQEGASA